MTGKLTAYNLGLKGKAEGQAAKVSYDEGKTHVDATWKLDPSGRSFRGTFQASNGNQGVWNGWKADPAAAQGPPADFAGLWLTDLGLMELTQEDAKVKGRYALRGTSSLDGEVKGRHLDFRIKAMRTGPGWFDLVDDGKALTGAGGTDGMPSWYGWKGRKAPEYVRHAPLVAGQIVEGSTDGLLTYSARAPEGYQPDDRKKWPTVVILHGSNMDAKSYVNTIATAWPDVARDFILLGINGELPSNIAAENPAFNYTYVNYVGRSTFKGFPGTDRESPALVSEAIDELRKVYPVAHYLIGGHSQGGFLTYSLLMNAPEAIAGAFPISGGLIFQCEPSAYDDADLKAAQRRVPLVIVHGTNDPVMGFDSGAYPAGLFGDAGWPAFRFLTDDNAGHRFGLLPVGDAIRWLEAMASDDPAALLDFAAKRLDESAPRDAVAATNRAAKMPLDAAAKDRLAGLVRTIDETAAPQARTQLEAVRADTGNGWVDGFLAFRDAYEFAPVAAEAMAAFDALRARHEPLARKAMAEARGFFQKGQRPEGYAKAQEVVDHYYAAPQYRLAKKWVAEQK